MERQTLFYVLHARAPAHTQISAAVVAFIILITFSILLYSPISLSSTCPNTCHIIPNIRYVLSLSSIYTIPLLLSLSIGRYSHNIVPNLYVDSQRKFIYCIINHHTNAIQRMVSSSYISIVNKVIILINLEVLLIISTLIIKCYIRC